jgi:hypothetical protein
MLVNSLMTRTLGQIVHVIRHCNTEETRQQNGSRRVHHMDNLQQIEEELATLLHLLLHGSASLECVSRADDECKVVGPQFRVVLGRVGISVASTGEDGRALNARLETLLAKSETL